MQSQCLLLVHYAHIMAPFVTFRCGHLNQLLSLMASFKLLLQGSLFDFVHI